MKRRVIVLGATGSIGINTLDVLRGLRDRFEVVALAAGSNDTALARLANEFRPGALALSDAVAGSRLNGNLESAPRLFLGPDALEELVSEIECDIVVAAVVGTAGLRAVMRAIELGRRIALANKETMVVAGSVMVSLAKTTGAEIIPVDSEHSGVFQALQAGRREEVEKVYLTASGGPFRTWSLEQMASATLEDALQHPTWDMGPKVTIDSATMMNKALEVVEARWLFGLPAEKIDVLVHPQSIIHCLVEYRDGSIVSQLSAPDMRTPIQYGLTFPDRLVCPSPALNLREVGSLILDPPDEERFPALRLGREVAARGGTCGAVMNAANEAAVDLFRTNEIGFREIAVLTEHALKRHEFDPAPTLAGLLAADRWAREEVSRCVTC